MSPRNHFHSFSQDGGGCHQVLIVPLVWRPNIKKDQDMFAVVWVRRLVKRRCGRLSLQFFQEFDIFSLIYQQLHSGGAWSSRSRTTKPKAPARVIRNLHRAEDQQMVRTPTKAWYQHHGVSLVSQEETEDTEAAWIYVLHSEHARNLEKLFAGWPHASVCGLHHVGVTRGWRLYGASHGQPLIRAY